jgi:PAS domain S-box-containing protein
MGEIMINKDEIREQFKDLFEYSLDFLYVNDLKGNFIDANDIALSTLGYEREEIPNISFQNLVYEDQLIIGLKNTRNILQKGKQEQPGVFKHRTKDGNYVYIETYGIPIKKEGKVYAIFGIAKNITEQKIAEQLLKESEVRYRGLYENTPFTILLINSKGIVVDCNPRTLEILGYEKNEVINKKIQILPALNSEDLPTILDLFKRMISGERLHRVDLRLIKKDGNTVWMNLQASKLEINKESYVQAILHEIKESTVISKDKT